MSQLVLDRLKAELGERVLATSSFRGDDEALIAPADWLVAARLLRDDPVCTMDHFIDLTAVDYPMREPELPRFDVVLLVRSLTKNHRVRLKTRVRDAEELDSVISIWQGADWTERECYDMFGIRFRGHPDLRRILMYEEFVGYPLRKDYPLKKTQPLIPYRDVPTAKLAPFKDDMGNPFGRIDWLARLGGRDLQVSPAIAEQQGQRPALSSLSDEQHASGTPAPGILEAERAARGPNGKD
jgi:NADH-quinone oxidoreductase subunit C